MGIALEAGIMRRVGPVRYTPGAVLYTPEEQDVYRYLKLPFVPPAERL